MAMLRKFLGPIQHRLDAVAILIGNFAPSRHEMERYRIGLLRLKIPVQSGILWIGFNLKRSGFLVPNLQMNSYRILPLSVFYPATKIISGDKIVEVCSQLDALNGSLFDRLVHPLNLTLRPGMLQLVQPMLYAAFVTDPIEDVAKTVDVTGALGELNSVVYQYGMD